MKSQGGPSFEAKGTASAEDSVWGEARCVRGTGSGHVAAAELRAMGRGRPR